MILPSSLPLFVKFSFAQLVNWLPPSTTHLFNCSFSKYMYHSTGTLYSYPHRKCNNVSLYRYTTVCLLIHQLKDILVDLFFIIANKATICIRI